MWLISNTCDFYTGPSKLRENDRFFWRRLSSFTATHSKAASECWRWCGRGVGIPKGKDPGTDQEAGVSDSWHMHALKVLLSGFFRKNSKTWGKSNYTHTHNMHTESQYLHFKFLFCEMAWEKLADRFPGELGISRYFPVHHSPVGLPASQAASSNHKKRNGAHSKTQHTADTWSNIFF